MKKTIVTLIVVGLVLATFSTVQAQSSVKRINLPFSPDVVFVDADQDIVLRYGWIGCNRAFLDMFDRSYYHSIWMDDVQLVGGSWTKHLPYSGVYVSDCKIPGTPMWNDFNYFLGKLPPGEYQISFVLGLTRRILDGADVDDDRHLDYYGPGDLYDIEITIVVQ